MNLLILGSSGTIGSQLFEKFTKKSFINSIKFSDKSISLPVGPHLRNQEMKYIYANVSKLIKKIYE